MAVERATTAICILQAIPADHKSSAINDWYHPVTESTAAVAFLHLKLLAVTSQF
jgi:hypothetical protein